MTITEAHKIAAAAVGEMSLSITKREAKPEDIRRWADALQKAATGLEARIATEGLT